MAVSTPSQAMRASDHAGTCAEVVPVALRLAFFEAAVMSVRPDMPVCVQVCGLPHQLPCYPCPAPPRLPALPGPALPYPALPCRVTTATAIPMAYLAPAWQLRHVASVSKYWIGSRVMSFSNGSPEAACILILFIDFFSNLQVGAMRGVMQFAPILKDIDPALLHGHMCTLFPALAAIASQAPQVCVFFSAVVISSLLFIFIFPSSI